MKRDMSEKAFRVALERYGIKDDYWMGYHSLGNGISASVLNAGPTRREQLAYLLKARDRMLRLRRREMEATK